MGNCAGKELIIERNIDVSYAQPKHYSNRKCSEESLYHRFLCCLKSFFRHLKLTTEGCLANSDGANSDDRANSDDFLGKSLNFFRHIFYFFWVF